ncbi:unnamed protein product, partial [Closterium sp. NIES-64]
MAPEAWYMDDKTDDQRLPHRLDPNQPCSLETLSELGILYWKLDADIWKSDPPLPRLSLFSHPSPVSRLSHVSRVCPLAELGILHWKLDADIWKSDPLCRASHSSLTPLPCPACLM